MLAVAAGDNVVRLLPPLIVSEDGNRRSACARIERACARCSAQTASKAGAAAMSSDAAALSRSDRDSRAELRGMIDAAAPMKARAQARAARTTPLAGKTLAMIFDKPSTRTRVSFDVAHAPARRRGVMLTGQEMQLGRGETIADTARVLSRYVDAIMIRILDHDALIELAATRPCR